MSVPLAPGGNDIDNDAGNGQGGKTEWEDALIKHKIWKPRPNLPREDDIHLAIQEIREQHDELNEKSLKQLEEMEDDLEEDVLEKYRKKRLEELKQQRAKERFGQVYRIGEAEFVQEVSEASKEAPVAVHLFSYGKEECRLVNQCFAQLAARRKDVKFVTIVYNEAIRDYPESATPTILLYHQGAAVHQIVGLVEFGGRKMNADCLEWVLAQHKLIETQIDTDPRIKLQRQNIQRLGGSRKLGQNINRRRNDTDSEDDESDRDSHSGSDDDY